MFSRSILLALTICVIILTWFFSMQLFPLPWIRDMHTSPALLPYERPMSPAQGTLSVNGEQILTRAQARNALTNPLSATSEVLKEGKNLYAIYCSTCHGKTGEGNGIVAEYFRRVPNLSASYIQNYSDGSIYTVLRQRGALMPSYADSLSVNERWALVHYIQTFRNN